MIGLMRGLISLAMSALVLVPTLAEVAPKREACVPAPSGVLRAIRAGALEF